jgi:hypothetical protein
MLLYDKIDPELKKNIRILGLTASIVQKKCNLEKFNQSFKRLEEKFRYLKLGILYLFMY